MMQKNSILSLNVYLSCLAVVYGFSSNSNNIQQQHRHHKNRFIHNQKQYQSQLLLSEQHLQRHSLSSVISSSKVTSSLRSSSSDDADSTNNSNDDDKMETTSLDEKDDNEEVEESSSMPTLATETEEEEETTIADTIARCDDEHSFEQQQQQQKEKIVTELKRKILSLAASYDRGYGATDSVRNEMNGLIDEIGEYNKQDDVVIGFEEKGEYYVDPTTSSADDKSQPLKGTWQMIWTTAYDVLSIATPISTVSAIYQDINPSTCTAINIIDLIPRTQAFVPPNIPSPVTRLKVQTKATRRGPKRVGLLFESVQIEPLKNIIPVNDLPFTLPEIKFDLPTKYIEEYIGKNFDSPGYFDVTYVDNDMLIIKQNQPGGCFISIKVPNADL